MHKHVVKDCSLVELQEFLTAARRVGLYEFLPKLVRLQPQYSSGDQSSVQYSIRPGLQKETVVVIWDRSHNE